MLLDTFLRQLWDQLFGWVMPLVIAILTVFGLAGCSVLLEDHGEVGVEFRQGVIFSHTASETHADSKSTLDAQSAVEYILDLKGDSPMDDDDEGSNDPSSDEALTGPPAPDDPVD